MFKKLKECKTLTEIYQVLGDKPFEVVALVLLILWVLLPIFATIGQIELAYDESYELMRNMLVASDYQHNVQSLGILSLEFAGVWLLGRILLNKGQILKKSKSEPWHFFLLAMLLWSCISTLLSDDLLRSFKGSEVRFEGLQTYFFYAAVYICALIVINSKRKTWIPVMFSVVGNFVSLAVILQDAGYTFWSEIFVSELAAMFFHFNHTGYYLTMAIVCSMGMYLFSEKRVWRIWYLISMVVQVFAILVNSTLASFIASWCALIMLLIFFVRYYGKFVPRMIVPVLVVVFLCAASYHGLVPTSSGEDMKYNIRLLMGDAQKITSGTDEISDVGHGRMKLWIQGLKMIPKRPVFGYGPEMLDEELAEAMWVDRPDNELIQYGIFLGIPGLAFYLIALIWLFINQWKKLKQLDIITIVAAGCVIGYLVSSLFGNSMFYTTPYLYMFLSFASGREKSLS